MKELIGCPHCKRQNWHEKTHCTWCARPLPTIVQRKINWFIVICTVIIGYGGIAAWLILK